MKYPRSTHYSDVQVPPQWHQWLRYQRQEPPTLLEQQTDVARRARMKVLAAQADARWAAKPSFLDQPEQQPKGKNAAIPDAPPPTSADAGAKAQEAVTGEAKQQQQEDDNDPWKKAATGPSEAWQPTSWSPSSSRKR